MPFLVIVLVAVLAFLFGHLARPLLQSAGNRLLRWTQGWGKTGAFRRRYLTSLVSQCRHLPMLPANVVAARWEYRQRAVQLEELYIPLSLGTEYAERPEMGLERIMAGRTARYKREPRNRWQQLWWRLRPPHEPTAGDMGQVIQNQPLLVIRGDPGSGKTTLMRYLTLTCARSLRNDRSDGDSRQMAKRRLGWRKARFPILVSLNRLSDVTSWPEDRRLVDEIVDTLPGELRKQYPKDFLEDQLRRGSCLILFDGFDELGSREARGRMARLIADMVDAYGHNDNRYVVSTRIVGYEGQLNACGFTVRTVQDLDSEAVRDLVMRRYRAVALSEGIGRSEQEQKDLSALYEQQASRLLSDLQRNERLRELTKNPLLLSLVVLVHMVHVALPEQRHILYRDCVEILTERWQARKREEMGMTAQDGPDALSLDQKIVLLQDIALEMQKRRSSGDSQALLRRDEVEAAVAAKLPSFIAGHLPENEEAREQECSRRAELLLDNIRQESGILTERGLDDAGEPVVGFSHLTFQEYLAADAIRERPAELPGLLRNLFQPSWREVLLLYVCLADANPIIRACLEDGREPMLTRILLAGRCLAEKTTVDPGLRQQVITTLRGWFWAPQSDELRDVDDFLELLGGEKNYDWLIENLSELLTEEERDALGLAGDAGADGSRYASMQRMLERLMLESKDLLARVTTGRVLSRIGDARDLDEMVPVPAGPFLMGSDRYDSEKPQHEVNLEAFRIGKYPVTNGQYGRFVQATGYEAPRHWKGDRTEPWMETQPVVNVSWHDAMAYCRWLSETSGQEYRLPTEAEWEKAARGIDGRTYPWGEERPDNQLCNFEMNAGGVTPVGIFPKGASPYGALDMAGNVWEWTSSKYRPYPYDADDGREDPEGDDARTLRGGSFFSGLDFYVRCAYRFGYDPGYWFVGYGFRVVASPGP